ncbi:uncharacterized protein LY79DRAFT_583604 [Colletotrichum navitas]|uniref:Uncharacterized protein n=1 Tax=Colletotrichum navitas TaxID=681940 RepID=A0AAD8PNJ6_9PEZI|nr:uncharacterized protein LY79DRAFT_583604 [Colletotrichum navitas]KAK1573475.1 hypothetical protein LY79DRAFT_583604 [Colletotrichum navitas]
MRLMSLSDHLTSPRLASPHFTEAVAVSAAKILEAELEAADAEAARLQRLRAQAAEEWNWAEMELLDLEEDDIQRMLALYEAWVEEAEEEAEILRLVEHVEEQLCQQQEEGPDEEEDETQGGRRFNGAFITFDDYQDDDDRFFGDNGSAPTTTSLRRRRLHHHKHQQSPVLSAVTTSLTDMALEDGERQLSSSLQRILHVYKTDFVSLRPTTHLPGNMLFSSSIDGYQQFLTHRRQNDSVIYPSFGAMANKISGQSMAGKESFDGDLEVCSLFELSESPSRLWMARSWRMMKKDLGRSECHRLRWKLLAKFCEARGYFHVATTKVIQSFSVNFSPDGMRQLPSRQRTPPTIIIRDFRGVKVTLQVDSRDATGYDDPDSVEDDPNRENACWRTSTYVESKDDTFFRLRYQVENSHRWEGPNIELLTPEADASIASSVLAINNPRSALWAQVSQFWICKGRNYRNSILGLDPVEGPFAITNILDERGERKKSKRSSQKTSHLIVFLGYNKREWHPASCVPDQGIQDWEKVKKDKRGPMRFSATQQYSGLMMGIAELRQAVVNDTIARPKGASLKKTIHCVQFQGAVIPRNSCRLSTSSTAKYPDWFPALRSVPHYQSIILIDKGLMQGTCHFVNPRHSPALAHIQPWAGSTVEPQHPRPAAAMAGMWQPDLGIEFGGHASLQQHLDSPSNYNNHPYDHYTRPNPKVVPNQNMSSKLTMEGFLQNG